MPDFGFKAKPNGEPPEGDRYDSMPDFGFKAKPCCPSAPACTYDSMPDFGFKAKRHGQGALHAAMIACLILDSRQNELKDKETTGRMIACLILDSRQN